MDALVRKYKRRLANAERDVPDATSPVESSGVSGSDTLPPALKRKHKGVGGEGINCAKRSRVGSDAVDENLLALESDIVLD